MIGQIRRMIPDPLQPMVDPVYRRSRCHLNQIQRALDRRTLNARELQILLKQCGLRKEAVVMVHSSMDELSRRVPGLTAVSFINMLMDLVTADGTVLMP